ncbi:bifunctional metallophosphatase/5'-nucleotidase [Nocardioides mangrovicus]|nr:bifunctional metallophosphatase/5'-nucleotidase [Nocardioides mangrovicus]
MHARPRYARSWGVLAAGAAVLVTATTVGAPSNAAGSDSHGDRHRKHSRYEKIQILSFNDFHGNLEPPAGSSGRLVTGHTATGADTTIDAGGVAYLAKHLQLERQQARKQGRHTITVAAGDIIGASPLLSAAFHDEPTIEAMNKLGLSVTSVGNHEFDEGWKELRRMRYGGCIDDGAGANNQNSCAAHRFKGAKFDMLAANVKWSKGKHRSLLPSYTIKKVGDAKIGFIGMTLKGTPDIVTAAGIKGLTFTDEVKTANRLVPKLKRKGVKAIVVLIHQGGVPAQQSYTLPNGTTTQVNPTYDYACSQGGSLIAAQSPILPIAAKLSPEIDMVVSGHTHQPYVCKVKDPKGHYRLLTSASSFGRLITDTDLTYDKVKGDIVRTSVKGANLPVTRDVTPSPTLLSLINTYENLVRPIASKVLGRISGDVTRNDIGEGEQPLGDLIADAQLADPTTAHNGKTAQIAFMNPGGIRADLTAANSPYGEATGDVTYDEAFTVQPFNNYIVSLDLTGQDIYDLLAQQVTGANAGSHKILQVSNGFSYRLGSTGAVDGSVTLNGTPISKTATYRVATNNFLQGGGDGFGAFTKGTDVYYGGLDIDAFADYLQAHSPYTPPTTATRILP